MNNITVVTYCDAKGQEHDALVFAVNVRNPGYVSLVYVDDAKPENDNIVKLIDVRHMDTIAEPNPALPTYHLNCWKERWTESNPLPADHPAYDHPHLPTTDQDGKPILVDRPLHDAEIAAHQLQTGYDPSSEGAPAVGSGHGLFPWGVRNAVYSGWRECEAAPSTPRLTEDQRISALEAQVADLKAQLAATTEGKDAALQAVADAGAAEQNAAEATSGAASTDTPAADTSKSK